MYSVQCALYGVQYTVCIVRCTMYSKVVLLSVWTEPQSFSVEGVEVFARLLLCRLLLQGTEESSQLGF